MVSCVRMTLLVLLISLRCTPLRLSADERTTDPGRFPRLVHLLLLPEEWMLLEGLKEDKDRREFQKIFWARRDPDLETPVNEYRTEYEAAKADVDTRYRVSGHAGSATDCGRVYILLGAPDQVTTGDGHTKLDAPKMVRQSQEWTYRNNT